MPRIILVISAAMLAFILLYLLSLRAPQSPVLLKPANNETLLHDAGGAPFEFRWRHGSELWSYPMRWQAANYFAVCLKEYQAGDFECRYPASAGDPPWARPKSGYPSSSAATNPRFAERVRTYWLPLDVFPSEFHDRDMMWTVGACKTTAPNSCNFPKDPQTAHRFRYVTSNLSAVDIQEFTQPGGNSVRFEFVFQNTGGNASGPFDYRWQVIQLWADPSYNARTDVNAADIDPAIHQVLKKDGTVALINTLPAASGGFDNSEVIGIVEPGGTDQGGPGSHAGLSQGVQGSEIQFVNLPGTAGSGTPIVMGLVLEVDTGNAIVETDESAQDNVYWKPEGYIR